VNGNNQLPTLQDIQKYTVNRKGEFEAIRQSLYDFQTYDAAGQTSLSFFQVPLGQAGKTIADTNMEVAGSLPQPKYFLVEAIEIYLFPGVLPGLEVTTIAETEFTNDVYTVQKSGSVNFFIGSKTYLEEAPIGRFPPKTRLQVDATAAIEFHEATNTDSEKQVSVDYATFAGRPYFVTPPVTLIPNQNFKVTLSWPAVVALPSGQDARIGVILDGILYRQSQ
jgi:hypothetical protein